MDIFLLLSGTAIVAFVLAAAPVMLWTALKQRKDGLSKTRGDSSATPSGNNAKRGRGAFLWSQRSAESPETADRPPTPPPTPEPAQFASIGEFRKPSRPPRVLPATVIAVALAVLAAAAFAAARLGWLGPMAAFLIAAVLGAGALVGAERLNRVRPEERGRGGIVFLTTLGLIVLTSSGWLAASLLNAIPALAALLIHVGCVAAALLYSWRYGSSMLVLALVGALCAPALAGDLGPEGTPLVLSFLAAALGAVARTARNRSQLPWCWIAGLGALVWGLTISVAASGALVVGSLAAYLAAISLMGLVYASSAAREPVPLLRPSTMRLHVSEPLLVGGAAALAAMALCVWLFARAGDAAPWAAAGVVAIAAGGALVAAFAEGLLLFALGAAVIAIALPFGWWPSEAPLAVTAAALSISLAVAGWFGVSRAQEPAPGALLAAFGPLAAVLTAYIRVGPLGAAELWAGAGGALAALNALFFVRLRNHPNSGAAASIFLAGAAFAGAAAIMFGAPDSLRMPALALFCLVLAIADLRLDRRELPWAAACITPIALAFGVAELYVRVPLSLAAWPDSGAVFALLAAALFVASALILARGGARLYSPPALVAAFGAAAATAIAAISLMRGHASEGAAFSLAEIGVYALTALGISAALSVRFGAKPRALIHVAELLALALALLLILGVNGVILNPWWGIAPAPVRGPMLFNELIVAYAAPALGFVLYGWLRAAQGLLLRANVVALAGIALAPVWLSLELRRLFHSNDMASAPVAPAEILLVTLLWLAFAAGLNWLGRIRGIRPLRFAGYILAFVVLAKAAVFDVASLDSAAFRIGGFVLVAAAAVGVIVLYNRRRLFRSPTMQLDPNLLPPQ